MRRALLLDAAPVCAPAEPGPWRAVDLSTDVHINKPTVAVGDRVWVHAFALPRGKARGTVKAVKVEEIESVIQPFPDRLHLYTVIVTMDAPIRVPRIAYRECHIDRADRWRRIIDWPGATEVEVCSWEVEAL